jgi:hypothetical protein
MVSFFLMDLLPAPQKRRNTKTGHTLPGHIKTKAGLCAGGIKKWGSSGLEMLQ